MYLIGIAGGSGSGKTTLALEIKKRKKSRVTIISIDNYYRDQSHLSFENRSVVNYDDPETLELNLLFEHLLTLKKGLPAEMPIYDFSTHTRNKNKCINVMPNDIVIVEGIYALYQKNIRELFDLKIYCELDSDERLLRRIKRDIKERNRTIDDIEKQYLTTVKKMHYLFVEPTKKYADIIVNDSKNKMVLDLLSRL